MKHSYGCRLNENSGQGTTLMFDDGYVMQLHDDNNMVFVILYKQNNNWIEWINTVHCCHVSGKGIGVCAQFGKQ